MKLFPILAAAGVVLCCGPTSAQQAPTPAEFAVTPELMTALLRLPGGSRSTYEDVMASVARPIRFYDFDGDGLSASELASVSALREQAMRAEGLSRLLRFDLTNDRIVSSEEFDKAMRISEASGGGGGRSREMFDRADGNHDGSVTFDEMLTLPPEQRAQIDQEAARLSSATIAIDPTPSTNFTLEDARILVDAVFAAYDTDRDGVLSAAERKAAGARS